MLTKKSGRGANRDLKYITAKEDTPPASSASTPLNVLRYDAVEFLDASPVNGRGITINDMGLRGECKTGARFRHHQIMEEIAQYRCRPGESPILITRDAGGGHAYATVPLLFLACLMADCREAGKVVD